MELIHLNTVWIVIAAAMVLFMEGGFSLLEAGLVRTKNAVNVTMKIFVDLTIGIWVWDYVWSRCLWIYRNESIWKSRKNFTWD
jgi:ammonia channel protein AmtB